jgi:hypothetical protein
MFTNSYTLPQVLARKVCFTTPSKHSTSTGAAFQKPHTCPFKSVTSFHDGLEEGVSGMHEGAAGYIQVLIARIAVLTCYCAFLSAFSPAPQELDYGRMDERDLKQLSEEV